ncbi:MAG: transposase [Acetobacteraceae bacterium]
MFLLVGADKRAGLIGALSALFPACRDPAQSSHSVVDILRERAFAIGYGYPGGNDLDALRADPAFKTACGRFPDSGADVASPPTPLRLENPPNPRALLRRVRETASRIRLAFAVNCPDASPFRDLIGSLFPRPT